MYNKVRKQEFIQMKINASQKLIRHTVMAQFSPQSHALDLDKDLDRSVQQQGTSNDHKRDSGIGQLNFEQDYTHQPHENLIENNSTEFMRDSQFQQEGVFSYNDDYRMRQSMKSQEDFELQDVSGNSDMTDRNPNKSQNKKEQKSIAFIQNYKQNQVQNKSQQKKSQRQSIPTKNIEAQKSEVVQQTVKETLSSTKKQPQVPKSPIKQANPQISTPNKQINKTPEHKVQQPKQQSKQWSNISNNSSSSPKFQLQNLKSPVQFKEIPQVPHSKQFQSANKSKIVLVKESIVSVNEPLKNESFGSSIKDWFKTSTLNTDSIKQQNRSVNEQASSLKGQDAKEKYRRQMAAEMAGFQQNLTQHQKTNKLYGNVTDKQKEKQKVNKTHLPQPTSKKYLQTDSQEMGTDEYRMLLKISYEKKKQNYQMLKQWDKRRAENMNLHRNIIQMLQNEIDKRIKASLQNFEIYSNFFKQKLKQQEKFINSPVINTKYALQNNAISKNIYINCSVILNSLSEENYAKCKKVQDFITLIKGSVLKDLMEQHLNESQRELLKVREKISTLKNSLKKYNSETEEKSQELAKLFSESSNNLLMKSAQDFYSVQLEFLRCASQQILIQKRLGENCLEYYHTALNEEFKRAKVIRQALMTYSKGLKQTYSIELEDVGLEQLSKSEQTNLIKEFYSLEDMFDQRSSQMLKKKFSIPDQQDLSINHVAKFVENFEFENFNNRMLLLKEFNAKYFSSKETKNTRQQNCYMVITVDFCIHLFFSSDKTSLNFKPDVSLKIISKQLEIRSQKDQFIDIVKKQQKKASMISYFWDSKNQKAYRIKLGTKDAKEEFCDYVKKLMF